MSSCAGRHWWNVHCCCCGKCVTMYWARSRRVVCVKCQKIKSRKAWNVIIYRLCSHLLNDSSDLSDSRSIKNDWRGVFKSWAMFPIIATICWCSFSINLHSSWAFNDIISKWCFKFEDSKSRSATCWRIICFRFCVSRSAVLILCPNVTLASFSCL